MTMIAEGKKEDMNIIEILQLPFLQEQAGSKREIKK